MILPKEVTNILNILDENNYEAYVVGGAIRNMMLNYPPLDYDIVTNASFDNIITLFKNDFKVLRFGKLSPIILILSNSIRIEISSFKGKDLLSDLLKRDFTINSMCLNKENKIIDLLNGQKDLKNKVIKLCNENALIEDPIRILRAIRFSLQFNLSISDKCKKEIFKNKELLCNVSVERIQGELSKILISDKVYFALNEYKEIFFAIIPELRKMDGFNQHNKYHIYDVYMHTLKVVENTSNNLILRLAALFHDLGKVDTFSLDKNNVGHFYNHQLISKEKTIFILSRLKYDLKTIKRVSNLILFHDYPLNDKNSSLKKFLNKFGEEDIDLLFYLKKADALAQNPLYLNDRLQELDKIYALILQIINDKQCFKISDLDIDGNDLLKLNFNGKEIKEKLEELVTAVIENKIKNNKVELIKYITKDSDSNKFK